MRYDHVRKDQGGNMLNSCVIVGRVAEPVELRTTTKGNTVAHMIVEADKSFRNEDGTLGKDRFKVTLWRGIAEECASALSVGALVAIKGRMQSDVYERNETQYYNCEIIAERVAY